MRSVKESVFPLKENGLPQPLMRLRNDESGRTVCRAPCGVRNNSFFYRMKSPCDYTAIAFICLYLIMIKLFGLIIRLAGHIYTKLSEHLIVHARQNNA